MRLSLLLHPFVLALAIVVAGASGCGLIAAHLSRERALLQVDLLLDDALLAVPADEAP